MGGTSFADEIDRAGILQEVTADNTDFKSGLIRVIRGWDLWFLAFALTGVTRITALLLLLLLLLRLRRWFVFWLWLRLSPRCRRRSCRCRDAFTLRLLLPALDLFLLSAWLLLLWLRSRLLDASSFTLFLATASLRLNTRLLRSLRLRLLLSLHRSRGLLRRLLWSAASTSTFVAHLELLSLRLIRRVVCAHLLRDRRRARDHCRVVELPCYSGRDIDLPATPGGVHDCMSQRRHQQWIQHRIH